MYQCLDPLPEVPVDDCLVSVFDPDPLIFWAWLVLFALIRYTAISPLDHVADELQKMGIQTGGRNQVNGHAERVFQIKEMTCQLQPLDCTFINVEIDIAVLIHISAGVRAK